MDEDSPVLVIEEALRTILRRTRVLDDKVEVLLRRRRRWLRFAYFTKPQGDAFTMPSITAPDITTSLSFGLIGNTPTGDTFAEPTVNVTTGQGTVTLQPSVQGTATATGTPFTTAGTFTPTSGFTGAVQLSAEVQGVDDQDCTFNVVPVPAPETVAFDPGAFKAA